MEAKVRLVNSAGTPITTAAFNSSLLQAEVIGLNGKGDKEGMELESKSFTNGVATLEYPSADKFERVFSELKTLTFTIEIVEGPGFYRANSITYKVSLDCARDPRYVDYDAVIAKLNDEKKVLERQLDAAKEAGDDALVAELKDQIAKKDDLIKAAQESSAKQEEAGITPTVCVLEGFPTKVSLPLKQIVRTPEQKEVRRDDINRELVTSEVKKIKE